MYGPHPAPTCQVCRQPIKPGCPSRCVAYTVVELVASTSPGPWGRYADHSDLHAVLTALVDVAAGKPAPSHPWPAPAPVAVA